MDNLSETLIALVVVIYNKDCNDSITCKALSENLKSNMQIYVIDNSEKKNHNEDYCRTMNWNYIKESRNIGLSKAYNSFLNRNKLRWDWVVWLDDDTHISAEYLNQLNHRLQQKSISADIIVPIIVSQTGNIISPAKMKRFRVKRIKNPQYLQSCDITAINTCMAIKRSVFDSYRYDERLFLDYIDHNFIIDMKKRKHVIMIIPVTVIQEYFLSQPKNIDQEIERLKIKMFDYIVFSNNKGINKVVSVGNLLYWGLKYTSKYKNVLFIKETISAAALLWRERMNLHG